jgi:O-antigen/teichoic acid export membrane protein
MSDQGLARYKRLLAASGTALAARGVAVATSLVLVPLTVRYLGGERYGVWATLSSVLAWLQIADLGIGAGMTNQVTRALGISRPEDARRVVATAFWLLVGIAVLLVLAASLAWPWLSWVAIFKVQPGLEHEVEWAAAVALLAFAFSFPLSIIDRLYAAQQQGAIAGAWGLASSFFTLASVYLATRFEGGLPALVCAFSGSRLLVQALSATWLFGVRSKQLRPSITRVNAASLRPMLAQGIGFFFIQATSQVFQNTDTIIITQILGPQAVTPYAVAWRLFSVPGLLIALVFPFLWPAYADARSRGDQRWVRRTFAYSILLGGGSSLLVATILGFAGKSLINWWAGPSAMPSSALLFWMAAWSVLSTVMSAVSCLLNACGRVKGQMLYGVATAATNLGLSIYLGKAWGISGVIAATVLAYCVFAVIPASLEARALLRREFGETDATNR